MAKQQHRTGSPKTVQTLDTMDTSVLNQLLQKYKPRYRKGMSYEDRFEQATMRLNRKASKISAQYSVRAPSTKC